MKGLIPDIVPFGWDGAFADLDRALHFGRQPYEWLMPVLGSAWPAAIISLIYNLWLIALLVFLFCQVLQWRDDALRLQCLLAFGLTWFIGTNLLGTAFSSAGPCYYGLIVPGSDPFQPLMGFLNAANEKIPILSLDVQAKLWNAFATRELSAGDGISAMPSMHVASAVLFVLLAAEYRRWLAWVAAGFAAVIFVGSVILGWHYAVDGYVGALLAIASWRIAGVLVRSRLARQVPLRPAAATA
jgi:membrane-associated phospholipid phosphatase